MNDIITIKKDIITIKNKTFYQRNNLNLKIILKLFYSNHFRKRNKRKRFLL